LFNSSFYFKIATKKNNKKYMYKKILIGTALSAIVLLIVAHFTLAANTQTTTSLGIGDVPPYFTAWPSDGGSSASSPTNAGQNVTLTATATDPNGDQWYLAVCKTNSVSAGNNAAPTCPGGDWAVSATPLNSGASATLNYMTLTGDAENNPWYAFACDKVQGTGLCSPASQGGGRIVAVGQVGSGTSDNFSVERYTPAGVLDSTFGINGKTTTDFNAADDHAQSVALQADGKAVAAGVDWNGTGYAFGLARYNTDGSLDTTFNSTGKFTTAFAGWSGAYGIAVQGDGKIVAAGDNYVGGSDSWDFTLVRLNADGTTDSSFGTSGVAVTDFSNHEDHAQAVAIQPSDGKIVAAGYSGTNPNFDFAIARYNTDGTLDSTFNSTGTATTAIGSGDERASAVTIQPSDGKIVAAGYSNNGSNNDFALVRYSTDGSLDTTFNSTGKVTTAVGSGDDVINSITIQSDGKILAAGYSVVGSKKDFAVVRYNIDGSVDTAFGTDGKMLMPVGTGDDVAYAIAIDPDGKIVVAGSSAGSSYNELAVVRLTSSGTLDLTFGTNGITTSDLGATASIAAIAIQGAGNAATSSPFFVDHAPSLGTVAIGPSCGSTASIDPGNAESGQWMTHVGTGDGNYGNWPVVQSDGKIVAFGQSSSNGDSDMEVIRYNADGTLDSTFGTGGQVTTDLGSTNDAAWSGVVQADKKIVAVGSTHSGSVDKMALVRYTSTGTLDSTFGAGAKVLTAVGEGNSVAYTSVLQSNGKIVVAGKYDGPTATDFALVRYNTDGSLDSAFGSGGKVETNFGSGYSGQAQGLTLQSDGKLVAIGFAGNYMAMARYNSDGSLDTTFGTGGKVLTLWGGIQSNGVGATVDSATGKIIATGMNYDGSLWHAVIARYNSDGSLDSSFGSGGVTVTTINGPLSNSILLSSGKIIAEGGTTPSAYEDMDILRFNSDGSLDSSFGSGGVALVDFGDDSEADGMALLPSGKILLTGYAYSGLDAEFALARLSTDGILDDLTGYACAQAAVADQDSNPASSLVDVHVCSTNGFSNGACTGTELCNIKGVKSGQSGQCVINGLVPVPTMHGTYPAYVFTVDSNGFQGSGGPSESYAVTDTPPYLTDSSAYTYTSPDTDMNITLLSGASTSKTYTVTVKDDNGDTDITGVAGVLFSPHVTLSSGTCTASDRNCLQASCTLSNNHDYTVPGAGMPASNQMTATCTFPVWYDADYSANWKMHANPSDTAHTVTDLADSGDIATNAVQALNVQEGSIAYGTVALGSTSNGETTTLQNYGNQSIDTLIQGTDMSRNGGGASIDKSKQKWSLSTQNFDYATAGITLLGDASGASSAATGCADTNLAVRTHHSTTTGQPEDQILFWKLAIPQAQTAGSYTGTNSLISAGASLCSDSGRAAVCGNGVIETGEQCDDGYTDNGDGCSSICQTESGWSCTGQPSVCTQTGGGGSSCTTPQSGIVSWWKGDGNTNDTEGVNNGTSSGVTYTTGKFGQAFAMNGTDSTQVRVPDNASLDSITFTIEAWLKHTTSGEYQTAVIKTTDASWNDGFGLLTDGTGTNINFYVNQHDNVATAPLPTGVWTHVAGTYDGATMKLYINGVLASTVPYTGSFTLSTDPLFIGSDNDGDAWVGAINDVRYYNRALSQTEIRTDANNCVVCGDGVISGLETCDDGNTTSGDGCSSTCQLESGFECTTTTPSHCDAIPSGLVSWWKAENNANDAEGVNNGTFENYESYAPGVVGNAFSCQDYGYISVPDSSSLKPSTITVEAWAYPQNLEYGQVLVAKSTDSSWSDGYGLVTYGQDSSYNPLINFFINDTSHAASVSTASLPTNTWSFVVGTYDGSNIKLYLNGSLVSTTPYSTPINQSTAPLTIGGDSNWDLWYGYVDEVRVYDRALTQAEIQADHSYMSICGDGTVAASEACDDGDTNNGDGCSSTCQVEPGYVCNGSPSICQLTCGDGTIETGEQCDDGNRSNGDGCSSTCRIESGYVCNGSPSSCQLACGDDTVESDLGEQCDDGNTNNGDGCSSTCQAESGYECHGSPSTCSLLGFQYDLYSGNGMAVALQSDGKIVAAGNSSASNNFTIARANSNGTLDTAFGTSGVASTTVGDATSIINAIAIQSDGKIVAVGNAHDNSLINTDSNEFGVVRYNTDGTLDTTFNSTGIVTTAFGSTMQATATGVAIQSDGKIVVTGFGLNWDDDGYGEHNDLLMARYNTDGTLDTAFGSGGTKTVIAGESTGNDSINQASVAIQPADQKIVVSIAIYSGNSRTLYVGTGYDFGVYRFTTTGAADTGFGSAGHTTVDYNGNFIDTPGALLIQSDGKIVVGGGTNPSTYPTQQSHWMMIRLTSNGGLDTGFGTSGKMVVALPGQYSSSYITSILQQTVSGTDYLVATGPYLANYSGPEVFALARYTMSNGALDTSFGTSGYALTGSSVSGNDVYAHSIALALQSDNHIVAVGSDGTYDGTGSTYCALFRYSPSGVLEPR
jgi:uncharacterized delta-60 repeat protein